MQRKTLKYLLTLALSLPLAVCAQSQANTPSSGSDGAYQSNPTAAQGTAPDGGHTAPTAGVSPGGNPAIRERHTQVPLHADEADLVDADFSALDADRDGEISVEENAAGHYFTEAQFSSIDTTHDNSIDRFEFADFQAAEEDKLSR